jgi:hypothetical protein
VRFLTFSLFLENFEQLHLRNLLDRQELNSYAATYSERETETNKTKEGKGQNGGGNVEKNKRRKKIHKKRNRIKGSADTKQIRNAGHLPQSARDPRH